MRVRTIEWNTDHGPAAQLETLLNEAAKLGVLVVRFGQDVAGETLDWELIEDWTASRAVTVADVGCDLTGPGLDVALCCDLVFPREGTGFDLGSTDRPPSAGVVWAMARSGRPALARGLLDGGRIPAPEAVRIGLAQEVIPVGARLPLPETPSLAALTAARDLMRSRSRGESGRALELATFRLLFASGDPEEGARAFLERRNPMFKEDEE